MHEIPIGGNCAAGFETVRDAFEKNFTHHDEVGAAVAVWVDGDLVVNLWGGYADGGRRRRWRENTLASVFSGTKGLTSTCIHLLADRGEIDLDAPVARLAAPFAPVPFAPILENAYVPDAPRIAAAVRRLVERS